MALDIKAKIEEIVNKIKNDESLQKQFKEDPIKAVESLLGVDLPDDIVSKVTDGVKAGLAADKIGSVLNTLKGFGK